MKLNPKQLEAVLGLQGSERFEHFVKVVTDWQQAWGLYQDGWALAATDEAITVFPLWPAKEYAEACAVNQWAGFEPRLISLDDLMNVLLPKLESQEMLPGVFPTPSSMGVTPKVEELKLAIETEMQNY